MFRLYPGMALTNIRSGRRMYLPYIVSCAITVSIYYVISSLSYNPDLDKIYGGSTITSYLGVGKFVVAVFALIFLFYINSFLVKRRKKEFGLYNILGMEKKHISRIVLIETLYVFSASFILGIFFGILLDKLMYLIISKMLDASVPFGFYISPDSVIMTLILFGAVFLLISLSSVIQIYRARPVDLLSGSRRGEAEPKAKWIIAVLGLICLATGYFIAVTTDNPVTAFLLFFAAVILVIAGTYMLFTSGSIALLKLLRKNKAYYYKTSHFVSVSSMMYRMKRNAAGLANICILSTMVLVMISAVISINLGLDDSFRKTHPREIVISAMQDDPAYDDVVGITERAFTKQGLSLEHITDYRDLSFTTVYEEDKDYFSTDTSKYSSGLSMFSAANRLTTLFFVPLEDYNRCMGTDETLSGGEVLVYSSGDPLESGSINVFDSSFKVKKTLDEFMPVSNTLSYLYESHFIVVDDIESLDEIAREQSEAYGDSGSFIAREFMADVSGGSDTHKPQIADAYDDIEQQLEGIEFSGYVECSSIEAETYGDNLAGLFFIGIFLSMLFVMATVLIMYYKQITEGHEDKDRYEIMQNVGMSHREVRKSINSQVLTVFFLPLIVAGIHMAFAFPFIYRIMTMLGLVDTKLYAMCNAGCFLVFALFYAAVYMLTSRLYYRIVKK